MKPFQPILARIPAWQATNKISVERIAGLTNANYLVIVNGERFVLRVSGENTSHLGINRRHELTALQAAAAAGIGPEVAAFLEPEGHLITRWVDGRHMEAHEFRTPENVRLLTETVRRIHDLPLNGAVFSPFRRVEAYLETARKYQLQLPTGLSGYLETMRAVEDEQRTDHSDWQRFCHNDLASVNYLYTQQDSRIIVLDWEFAGQSDIYYDLATIVYTHDNVGPIPPELEEVMLSCYFGAVSGFQRKRLQGMKFMLMLFTGCWGLAQGGMEKAGLIPAVEGFNYLEFADYLFAHDIQELQTQFWQ